MRSLPFYPLLILLLVLAGGYLGCDPSQVQTQLARLQTETASSSTHYAASIPDRTENTILVGSFNVQRLGPTKLSRSTVMEQLAAVIRQFDVVAIQEITSVDQRTLPKLVDLVNSDGSQYDFTISPRIGREAIGYYEQYAFVFDTNRIQSGKGFSYVVQDDDDLLHREPFVGRFRSRAAERPFQFTLINVHTDPDDIDVELDVLAAVYRSVRQYEYPEDDIILLGDLNAAPGDLQDLEAIPGVEPLIAGIPTTIRKNKTLDNILVDREQTAEFTGRAGTIDLEKMFRIDFEKVKMISDHLPIWAEFTIQEADRSAAGNSASESPGTLR